MATVNNLIAGLEIFKKYMNDGEDDIGGSVHDEIWFCPPEVEISIEDQNKLEKLGFSYHKENGWGIFT